MTTNSVSTATRNLTERQRGLTPAEKIRMVSALLEKRAAHLESRGMNRDANWTGALSDMLIEALEDMGFDAR